MRKRVSLLFFELEGWWRRIRREANRPGRVIGTDEAFEHVVGRISTHERVIGTDEARMRVTGRLEPL